MMTSPLQQVTMDSSTLIGMPGRIRVGKSDKGRWWLTRADDTPFLYRGICALWMPDNYTGQEANRFRQGWEQKNGKDTEAFVAHCLGLVKDRGLNSLGEWATKQFWNRGMPFTILIPIRELRPESNLLPSLPDIFDPALRSAFDARCREVCSGLAASTDLVGYYVDNEGGWFTMRRDFVWGQDTGPVIDRQDVVGKERLLLQVFLSADPKRPGVKKAWEWVLARHDGSMRKLAEAWGITCNSPEDFMSQSSKGLTLASKGYWDDHVAFTAMYVKEYFRFTAETIRRYDPNHLLLGCRFGGTPGREVLDAIDRRHVDILSWNCYNPGFYKRCEEFFSATGMPQLNGEYSWTNGSFLNWEKLQAQGIFSQEECDACRHRGQATLEQAITHPALVGYTWYKFCWNATAPDQPGYGIINEFGAENVFTSALLRIVNARLEGIACGQIQATKLPSP